MRTVEESKVLRKTGKGDVGVDQRKGDVSNELTSREEGCDFERSISRIGRTKKQEYREE